MNVIPGVRTMGQRSRWVDAQMSGKKADKQLSLPLIKEILENVLGDNSAACRN